MKAVVRCFQKRNFDIFATTLPAAKSFALSCEMLSKKELWYICNNLFSCVYCFHHVVRCFQKRNFDIFATTILSKGKSYTCCEMLSKKELWYICNNFERFWCIKSRVVRCFQKRNFDIFATTCIISFGAWGWLWDAFKKGTLIYLQQQ